MANSLKSADQQDWRVQKRALAHFSEARFRRAISVWYKEAAWLGSVRQCASSDGREA